jgi:hypothetical protein
MRKSIFIIVALCTAVFANAQTFKIISRSNDTIRLQSNKLGDALKSVVPNKSSEVDNNYRLIEKIENNKKSLLFVEFTQVLDKIFVTYETDLIHAGDWSIKAYSFADIFNSVKRENAILLKGQLLGMDIDIFQRPDNFKDIIRIDGIEFPSPVKVLVFENKITQEIQNKKNDMVKIALIEEDINQTKGKANECYIAYLLLTQKFDKSADRTLMNDLCNKDEVMSLKAKYNELQLKYLSQGHDNRLNKYEK